MKSIREIIGRFRSRNHAQLEATAVMEKNDLVLSASLPDGELVVFNAGDRRSYLLNLTASEVFSRIDGAQNINEIALSIHGQYDSDIDMITRDVKILIEDFFNKRIVSHVRP